MTSLANWRGCAPSGTRHRQDVRLFRSVTVATPPTAFPRPTRFRGTIRDDPAARAVYAEGAGIARAIPRAVVVPRDAEDLLPLLEWANSNRVPLIPRGSGSGMAGGATGDGVIVDCSLLDQIGPVDSERRTIRCGPGAIRAHVNAAANAHGLRFPVDPSSGPFCTVGGMAATNAAGARTLRFGATRSWIESLECVLADGTPATVRRDAPPPPASTLSRITSSVLPRWRGHAGLHHAVRKESSGYAVASAAESGDLVDLLAGSEGTLAVFAELELRLIPVPVATASALAAFRSLEDATVAAARAHELGASACELLDRTFLEIVASASPLPIDAHVEAVLLIEAEADSYPQASAAINAIAAECRKAGAEQVELALETATEQALWALRHAASPTLARLDPALVSMQFIEDACVPPEALPAYVRGVREALAARQIRGVIFGHAGDANVHVNPLIDLRRSDWRESITGVLDEVTELVASLGGTLTGEHGDGRIRTPLMNRVWTPEAMACFAEVKQTLDPAAILNPAVKIPSGEHSLNDIKYDPAIPPLLAEARAALDHIERHRAYSTFRLSLIDDG